MADVDRIKGASKQSPFHMFLSLEKVFNVPKEDGFVKKSAGKAREFRGVRRTFAYAAMTRVEAQRSIRAFSEAVMFLPVRFRK
jgi:hypothetical protein